MKKVIVAGYGNIGSVAAKMLRDNVCDVSIIENNSVAVEKAKSDGFKVVEDFSQTGLVMSCLPYFKNYELAKKCVALDTPYCDLGGHVQTSKDIEALDGRTCTDLGLAPGLISILGLHKLMKLPFNPDNVTLAVGGFGVYDYNIPPAYYTCNWSIDGLLNEYFDYSEVLIDGKITKIPSIDSVYLENLESDLEMFPTSGGIANSLETFQRFGVKNCFYKTIRNRGHFNFLEFLKKFNPETRKEIAKIAFDNSDYKSFNEDIVLLYIKMSKGDIKYEKLMQIKDYGEITAMQFCTAVPLCSVALMMLDGYNIKNHIDVSKNYELFKQNCENMGLFIK